MIRVNYARPWLAPAHWIETRSVSVRTSKYCTGCWNRYKQTGKKTWVATVSRAASLVYAPLISNLLSSGMTDESDAEYRLLKAVARSDGLNLCEGKTKGYLPLFKHPLPVSESRFIHEDTLRKVLSCKVAFQGTAAITRGDAWVLEEVYMKGGPVTLTPKNGSTPIHLAVQMKSIDCVMVLINIGVDVNVVNNMGFTPRFLAHSAGATQIEKLLAESGALMVLTSHFEEPVRTVLDVIPERGAGSVPIKATIRDFLRQPNSSLEY
jgi:hypothetical protein